MNEDEIREKQKQENIRIRNNMKRIKHRIVVFSGKGGVGKSTVSLNLALALQLTGNNTGLIDADITGPNITKMTGVDSPVHSKNGGIVPGMLKGLKIISFGNMIGAGEPVIWRGPMRSKLINSFLADVDWGSLDFLVADMPPGTGDEILTITQKMEPDMAVIVTTPQEVSLIDSHRAINMAKRLEIRNIVLIENMAGLICPECGHVINLFGTGGGRKQAENLKIKYLCSLPIDPEARELADSGKPFLLEKPDSEISKHVYDISGEIRSILND